MAYKKLKTQKSIDALSLFSHELKTPLSSMKLALDLIRQNLDSKNSKYLNIMETEVNGMIYLISDVLDMRLLQGKEEIFKWNWLDWKFILNQVTSRSKIFLNKYKKDLKIVSDLDPEVKIEILSDPIWMAKLLENLIMNGLKHSKENTDIILNYNINKKNEFEFSIKNEVLSSQDVFSTKKLFEPFHKTTTHNKDIIKNTGLGLSICKFIVEKHNGKIEFQKNNESEYEFKVCIPKYKVLQKNKKIA